MRGGAGGHALRLLPVSAARGQHHHGSAAPARCAQPVMGRHGVRARTHPAWRAGLCTWTCGHALATPADRLVPAALGGAPCQPLEPDDAVFRAGCAWRLPAFATVLGASYVQRLLAASPGLAAAAKQRGQPQAAACGQVSEVAGPTRRHCRLRRHACRAWLSATPHARLPAARMLRTHRRPRSRRAQPPTVTASAMPPASPAACAASSWRASSWHSR